MVGKALSAEPESPDSLSEPSSDANDSADSTPYPIQVSGLIPELLQRAIRGTKLLGTMSSESDRGDISAAIWALSASVQAKKNRFSDQDLVIGNLLFWVNQTALLNAEVYPHADYALSSYLAEEVNAVWAIRPDLIAPGVNWVGTVESGYSLAEVLCMRGILLDPQVLNEGPKQALSREFTSNRCIDLALKKGLPVVPHLGILDMMASISPSAGATIHAELCDPVLLEKLCTSAMDYLVVGASRASLSSATTNVTFDHARIMTSTAAQRLLAGLAKAVVKSPQKGWGSGNTVRTLNADGSQMPSALKCVAERVLKLAGFGYDLEGLPQVIREIGTIIGYPQDASGDKALAIELAGTVSLELLHIAKTRWPTPFGGGVDLNPQTNLFLAAMLGKYESEDTEGGSFLDGLMKYFVEAEILPDQQIAEGACTLRHALQKSMPAGTAESYEAMSRAREMADVIAKAGAENGSCADQSRRRGMRV